VPILGIVENYAYFVCPDNGKRYNIFGDSKAEAAARAQGLPLLGRIPVDPAIARACDQGKIENLQGDWLEPAVRLVTEMKV